MLKLKRQYFDKLMQREDSLEKTLKLGKTGQEGKRGAGDEMVRFSGHEFEQTLGYSGEGGLGCCSPWGHKDWDIVTEQQ